MGGVSSISAKLEFLSLSKEEVIDHFVETKENIVFVYFTEVEINKLVCGRVKLNVDLGFRYFRMSRRPEIGQSSGVVKSKEPF